MNFIEKANIASLNCFMNSFLRDFCDDSRVSIQSDLRVNLKEGVVLVPFKVKSSLGAHKFENNISLNHSKINLFELTNLVYLNFSNSAAPSSKKFVNKVKNSRDNILENLKFNSNHIENKSYIESEQSLNLGHPFHPYPKLKREMEMEDQFLFSPEFKTSMKLLWVLVPQKRFYSNLTVEDYKESIHPLLKEESLDVGTDILVPMHPWQWDKLKDTYPDIKIVKTGSYDFHPLSSLRTLFRLDCPFQIKFSMNLTLTNSIRHLQLNELKRGAELSEVLKKENYSLSKHNIELQSEPFFVGFIDDDGKVDPSTCVQFRENTFYNLKNADDFQLLSSLCEKGFSHLDKVEKVAWLNAFLKNVIEPFMSLYAEYGILLGAHMQNIIVELDKNIPKSVTYRDCQGTGFTLKAYNNLKNKYQFLSIENGNILDEEDTNKVFGYYLVINSVFSTISSLASSNPYYEKQYLSLFRNFIFLLRHKFEQNGHEFKFLNYLLESPSLFQKGNMRCCISEINENTIKNPWNIYNEIKNPLAELRQFKPRENSVLYKSLSRSGKKILLRQIEISDLDIFHSWHIKDYVSEFWELNKSKDFLLGYINEVKNSPYKLPMILEVDGEAAGYFEAYWAFEDRIAPYCQPDVFDRGIHLLFGEEKILRQSLVLESINHVTKFLLEDDFRTQKVWGEPRADNTKIIRIANKLPGWKLIKEFDFPHKRAMLLECDKKRFVEECNEL